jgi:hypothetical protein
MKIIITESQYELLCEQWQKSIKNLFKPSSKVIKPITKTIGKSINPELNGLIKTYIQKLGEDEFIKLRKSLLSKEISKEEFIKKLETQSKFNLHKTNFSTKVGIKFSERESNSINKLANDILGKSYEELSKMNLVLPLTRGNEIVNTKITFVNKEWVMKNLPEYIDNEMWAPPDEIVIFVDNMKGSNKSRIVTALTHEATHVKDPALVKSPKLSTSFPKVDFFKTATPWSDDWIKKYYTHPWEITAVNGQVLEHMTPVVKSKSKKLKPNEISKALDEIIKYGSGIEPTWSDLVMEILGYTGKNGKTEIINHFNTLNEKNPTEFRKLLNKLVKHSTNLKTELSKMSVK